MSWLASQSGLVADEEGLAIYRQIIEEADKYLTPRGKRLLLKLAISREWI